MKAFGDAVADPDENGYMNGPGVHTASAAHGIQLGDGTKSVFNAGLIPFLRNQLTEGVRWRRVSAPAKTRSGMRTSISEPITPPTRPRSAGPCSNGATP